MTTIRVTPWNLKGEKDKEIHGVIYMSIEVNKASGALSVEITHKDENEKLKVLKGLYRCVEYITLPEKK